MKISMEIELPKYKIVDFHAHFPIKQDDFLKDYKEQYVKEFGEEKLNIVLNQSEEYQKEWLPSWCFPNPEQPTSEWEKQAERWSKEVEGHNLEYIVFLTGGGNELLSKIIDKYSDKFIGFAHHNIEEENAAQILEHAITCLNLKGLKILGPLVETPLGDRKLNDVWETAEHYQIPVLIHFGILGGGGGIGNGTNISPLSIYDVAKRFPKLKIVIPHFGCGYVRELLQLCWACKNIYVDTSGNNEWIKWMPYYLDLKILFQKFYETIGPERIIFGSDSEWFPRGFVIRYLLEQLWACRQIRFNEDVIKLIFRDNAMRLLRL